MIDTVMISGENSRAVQDPFLATLSPSDDGLSEILKQFRLLGPSVSGIPRESEERILTGTFEQCERAVSCTGLMMEMIIGTQAWHTPAPVDYSQRRKNEAAILLLREWLADESGYDEAAWPVLKKAIEENRPSSRRRFGE